MSFAMMPYHLQDIYDQYKLERCENKKYYFYTSSNVKECEGVTMTTVNIFSRDRKKEGDDVIYQTDKIIRWICKEPSTKV